MPVFDDLPVTTTDDTIYFVEKRYLAIDTSEPEWVTLNVYPSKLYGIQFQDVTCVFDDPPCSSSGSANHDFLTSLPGASLVFPLPLEGNGSTNSVSLGSIVPIACIPNFPAAEPSFSAPIQ